jgi:formate C-acetyltransferase
MNERLQTMKLRVRRGDHFPFRRTGPVSIVEECEAEGLSWMRRSARLTVRQCEAETPVILLDEKIAFTRTLPARIPDLYPPATYEHMTAGRTMHELGPISNVCADWGQALSQGLLGRRATALSVLELHLHDPDVAPGMSVEFLESAIETIDAVLDLSARYASTARDMGRADIAETLEHVPALRPRTFREALQSLRIMHAVVWLSGHYHVGLGRFDQYMWPYLRADLEEGLLNENEAADLLAEFFISLNKDSDLYPGVQQGDNGQTIVLGGVDWEGKEAVNPLTWMTLRVSCDVAMIDPKINLRISPSTDLDLLTLASELTRKGLGFPQYSNDDVVISGLTAHGYTIEAARDYGIAACWEFLIPGRGMEVVNIGAVSFPAAVDRAVRAGLAHGEGMPEILACVRQDVEQQVQRLAGSYENLFLPPAPYYSVLMNGCLEAACDLSQGAEYNNFGIHGAGSSNAADALAAVEQIVLTDRTIRPADLLAAMDANYDGHEEIRRALAETGPKVGCDDDRADKYLTTLFDMLADACEAYGITSRGGCLRPGSGSAMYYIWLTKEVAGMREPFVGATAEGRRAGKPLGANLAPAQGALVRGPFSILLSYAKIDYRRICNGGPITLELSDTVFRDEDSTRKVAMLVRAFAQQGCQQIQLNSLSVETLREAQRHPESHKNLIVRVWGWSGYFCELGAEYQDQIIARHMHGL